MSRWPTLHLGAPRAKRGKAPTQHVRAPQFGYRFSNDYYKQRLIDMATAAERQLPAAKS